MCFSCVCPVANGEGILETILFRRLAADQFEAVAHVLPQDANRLFWNEGSRNQPEPKEVADPLGVFGVILVTLNSSNPLGIGDSNTEVVFQKIVDRDVILSGALHANVQAVVIEEPLPEFADGLVESGKAPLLVGWRNAVRCGDDCGDEKAFMDIDATTDGVNDFHLSPLLVMEY